MTWCHSIELRFLDKYRLEPCNGEVYGHDRSGDAVKGLAKINEGTDKRGF